MYTVTNDYETYVKSEARNYSMTGTIVNKNNVTMQITRDNILEGSLSFSNRNTPNNSFDIGGCCIGSMEITLQGDYHHSLYNAVITLQQGVYVTGDSYHMQKVGTWIIKKASWNGEWVTLECYDAMCLTQKKYSLTTGTFTPYSFFTAMCNDCGITLATTQAEIEAMVNGTATLKFNGSTQETDRKWSDLIHDMCAVICGFCSINRFGNLEVHQFGRCYKRIGTEKTYYTTAVDTLTKDDRITGGTFGNGAINITGLYINDRASTNSDKSILVGSTSGTTLNLGYNRWLSSTTSGYSTYLQNILTQLTACQFYAADVHLADVSLYDLGDLITLQAGGEMSLASNTLMCVMNIDYNFTDESTISSYTFSESSSSSTLAVESNLTSRIETLESSGGGNKIYTSKTAPDNTLGNDGDLCVKYHTENNDKFINSDGEEINVDIPRYESDNDALSYVDTTIRPILRTIKDTSASQLSDIVKQFEKECTVVLYQTYFSQSAPGGVITSSQFPQLTIDTYTVNNQSLSVIQGNTIATIGETAVTSRVIGSNKSAIVNVDDFDGTLAEDGGNWYVIYDYLYYNTTTKYLNVIHGYLDINWYFHTLPHDNLGTVVTNYSIDLVDTSVMIIDELYCKINGKWWEIYNGGTEYFAGNYIEITENNVITSTLKAGTNVQIADDGTISASGADVVQTVTSGTQLATINGTSIYAPTVSASQTQTSGTEIATINVGDASTKLYAPTTTVTQVLTEGTEIGEVNGTKLYAPTGGGSGGSAVNTTYDNTTSGLAASNVQSAIDEIAQDFQDGCDIITQAVTAKGQTPASNSPADIAHAISRIPTDYPRLQKVYSVYTDPIETTIVTDTGQYFVIAVMTSKPGVTTSSTDIVYFNGETTGRQTAVYIINCKAGDTISIKLNNFSGGTYRGTAACILRNVGATVTSAVQDWKVFKFDSTATMGKVLSLDTIYLCVGGSCGGQHSSSFDVTANLGSYYNSNCQESGINVSVINALSGTVNISQSQFGNIAGGATVSGYILTV